MTYHVHLSYSTSTSAVSGITVLTFIVMGTLSVLGSVVLVYSLNK